MKWFVKHTIDLKLVYIFVSFSTKKAQEKIQAVSESAQQSADGTIIHPSLFSVFPNN